MASVYSWPPYFFTLWTPECSHNVQSCHAHKLYKPFASTVSIGNDDNLSSPRLSIVKPFHPSELELPSTRTIKIQAPMALLPNSAFPAPMSSFEFFYRMIEYSRWQPCGLGRFERYSYHLTEGASLRDRRWLSVCDRDYLCGLQAICRVLHRF